MCLRVRLFFLFTSSCAMAVGLSAQTDVGGNITTNTLWSASNSPFNVVSDVVVYGGATLTIDPGVKVQFQPNTALRVGGALVARGSAESPIEFTAANIVSGWHGIEFLDSSTPAVVDGALNYVSGSVIQFATITYANGNRHSRSGPISCYGSSPLIADNILRFNKNSRGALWKGAITVSSAGSPTPARPYVIRNFIADNDCPGFSVERATGLTVKHNVFKNNQAYAVVIDHYAKPILQANTLVQNQGGILFEYYTVDQGTLATFQIDDNVLINDEYEIYLKYSISGSGWTLKVGQNFYGVQTQTQVSDRIYDYYRSINEARVDFMPFLTAHPSGTPTSPPDLVSPALTAANQDTILSIVWTRASGASSYHLQVSNDSIFASVYFESTGITDTSTTLQGLSRASTYYWRVRALNSLGPSHWSAVRYFSTIPFAPLPPVLFSPLNGASNIPVNLSFIWNAAISASSYRLQLSTTSDFASPFYDQDGITTTSHQVSSLSHDNLYYWRLNATNAGGTSSYSSTWSFTTIVAPPAAPSLASPSNGATGIATNPTLSWNSSTGASSYRLQVSTNSSFTSLVYDQSGITGTSQQVSGVANNTLYYWRVNAANAGGTSSYSSTWSFTTIVAAPAAPTLASPFNGATGIPTNLTLSWNASSGATSYGLQVSTNSNFTSRAVDASIITSTSYPVSGLANNTLYYWRVNATNAGGTSDWTAAWNFTTIAAAPAAPTLLLPSNAATGISISPTLGWNASAGATSYRLQVSTDSGFSMLVYDLIGITGTSQQLSGLANNTLYYWRVNATNAGGTSSYSSTWSFTIIVAAPATPTLASPSNGATGVSTSPTLSWNTSTGAISYRLQVSTNSSFTSLVYDQSGITGTSQQVSGLANNTLYYWRVNATNAGGTSDWSSFWNLTTTGPTSVERLNSEVPTTYHLSQNYPNPFNPVTIIQFSLPKESPVVLTIFNSLGMEIEVLLNQNLPAGHYRTQWTPRDIPTGVYFYQLKSTEFTDTKKLLLLR